jgi:phosphopantothenoylcysteine decarboxylase/phosphopantothenate--cysteine ligase
VDSKEDHGMAVSGKNIVLGVTGSIAAYKAADIAGGLRKAGADVHVVLTDSATRFVTPTTLATISRNPVHQDQFDDARWEPGHTALADEADLFVIAPATANIIAKMAHGIADDLLSTLLVAARCPTLVAPAMNVHMYESVVVQDNLRKLRERGVSIADPEYGMLACGYEGQGRLRSVEVLLADVNAIADASTYTPGGAHGAGDMEGLRVIVTAGPTREALDPVRFISNLSTGKMGYAVAAEAVARGADVTLISGPTNLASPAGVTRVDVQSAREMRDATTRAFESADIAVLSAAVADYEAAEIADRKIKKGDGPLTLTLRRTPDIAAELGACKGDRLIVAFAAETDDPLPNAREKLRRKNADLIVVNDITQPGAGFGGDTNIVTIIADDGTVDELPLLSKRQVAVRIFDAVRARRATVEAGA